MKRICKLISDYMGFLVLLAAVVALIMPNAFNSINPTVINPLLGVIMFGMGMALRIADFRIVFSRPKDVIIGCVAQFTIMPLLALALSHLFSLDEALAIGVVLVGCCPGGTASNVITYLAKGDLALSVGMTATSTILAPVLTPLLVWLLVGKSVDVNVLGMLQSILWVVILPIVAGLIVKSIWPKFTEKATAYLPTVSSLTIAFIVLIIIAANAQKFAYGRYGHHYGYHPAQHLWTWVRLYDRAITATVRCQTARYQYRGWHAEQRTSLQPCHTAFCRLPDGDYPWGYFQRMAQYKRCHCCTSIYKTTVS